MNKISKQLLINANERESGVTTAKYGQLYGSSLSLSIAEDMMYKKEPRLLICPDSLLTESMAEEIKFFNQTNQEIEVFPDLETGHENKSLTLRGNDLETGKGGHLYSVGVGGTTTGKSAGSIGKSADPGLFIIDDPTKDLAEAFSEVKRQSIKEWFQIHTFSPKRVPLFWHR